MVFLVECATEVEVKLELCKPKALPMNASDHTSSWIRKTARLSRPTCLVSEA